MEGRVCVVTGATGGIGLAICEAFLEEGALLAPVYRHDATKLEPLLDRVRELGLSEDAIQPLRADVTNADDVERCIGQVLDRFGRIDVLVNNAGVTLERPFLVVNEDDARRLAEVNLWAAMRLTKLVLKPMMRAKAGAVVNVTSVVASRGGRGVSIYAMTKAALESLTRVLALEMARKGIRLNAVAPGVIETPMSRSLRRRRSLSLTERIPMGRVGQPRDVAQAVLWLASDITAGYVTGQVLTVDGGWRL